MKTILTRLNIVTLWPSFLNLDGLCGRFTRLRAEGVTVKLFTRFQTYAGTCDGAYVFVFLNRNAKHSIIQFPLISQGPINIVLQDEFCKIFS